MKIPSIKDDFSSDIRERGEKYFRQGRVQNLILDDQKVKGTVTGTRNYRVTIDLKKQRFRCSCPCDFNCKHAAAVLYALRNAKEVENVDDLEKSLQAKTKDELVSIMKKMITSAPRLKKFMSKQDIENSIQVLSFDYDDDVDQLVEEVEDLYDLVEKQNNLDTMMSLFEKCIDIYRSYGQVEALEDSMFDMLETISESVRQSPQRRKIMKKIIALIGEYDFFLDTLDDEDISEA